MVSLQTSWLKLFKNLYFFVLLLLLNVYKPSLSAFCGVSSIPFRLEVLPSGNLVLGCAIPECFGAERGNVIHDSQFNKIPEGEDGFVRESDQSRRRSRFEDAPSQIAQCSNNFGASSCAGSDTWVGGFEHRDGRLSLQCCNYDGMRFAAEVGRPIVRPGEVYSGGEVIRDGRQTGFDLISNIKQISETSGGYAKAAYELTVHRMNCLPDPPETENDVEIEAKEITTIQNKVVSDTSQHLEGGPVSNDQVVQIGEACVPVQTNGYYYPVAGGVPACFSASTIVKTREGHSKRMDELEVGDYVESAEANTTSFAKVVSFVHRLPSALVQFIRLETANGAYLELSPQHFIHTTNCYMGGFTGLKVVYAEHLQTGECLFWKLANGGYVLVAIKRISVVEKRGAYSPMTETGNIVVNNLMASCHNLIRSEPLSHSFFHYFNAIKEEFKHLFQWNRQSAREAKRTNETGNEVHLPGGTEYILRILNWILPDSMLQLHYHEKQEF